MDFKQRIEYQKFMVNELPEFVGSFKEEKYRCYVALASMAVGGGDIPESLFAIYSAKLPISKEIWQFEISHYLGMGVVSILCDCDDSPFCLVRELMNHSQFLNGIESSCKFKNKRKDFIANVVCLKDKLGAMVGEDI